MAEFPCALVNCGECMQFHHKHRQDDCPCVDNIDTLGWQGLRVPVKRPVKKRSDRHNER
jgi:hypothetical protein